MPIRDRRSTIQTVGWVRDMHRSGQLDLDPPYQRRSAWNEEFKKFFIDTVLRNYPIPPIFVNVEVKDDGSSTYFVVDGKQRLLAILEFLDDRFPISRKSYSQSTLAGKYFSQLDTTTQRSFYSYFLPFEIFTELSQEDVNAIFDRFNRNVARLNRQELRHARHDGEFIRLMEHLADESFWRELRMFGIADVRRMKDVEYVSELIILTMDGIQDRSDDRLDDYYADHDEEFSKASEVVDKYQAVKSMVQRLDTDIHGTRLITNKADFYTLWSTLLDFSDSPDDIAYEATSRSLIDFAKKVDEVPNLEDTSQLGDDAVNYSQAVRAGTTKQPNRQRRKEILLKYFVQHDNTK